MNLEILTPEKSCSAEMFMAFSYLELQVYLKYLISMLHWLVH